MLCLAIYRPDDTQKGDYMNREEARKKATELVDQMTLEEMAAQLRYDAPAIERLGVPEYNWWSEGLHGVARNGTATVFPQAIGLGATFDTSSRAPTRDLTTNAAPEIPAFAGMTKCGSSQMRV